MVKLKLIFATLGMGLLLIACQAQQQDASTSAPLLSTLQLHPRGRIMADKGMEGACGDIHYSKKKINKKIFRLCTLVNRVRMTRGLQPLYINHRLNQVAQGHAQSMLHHAFLSHTGIDGQGPEGRLIEAGIDFSRQGENIAAGNESAEVTLKQWLNSKAHRNNILNPDFTDFGLSVAEGNTGLRFYWVQVFVN